MISTRLCSFAIVVSTAFVSTCMADIWATNPTATTQWVIGKPAEIRWRLTSPTAKTDTATIYLVGGDYTAYQRIEILAKGVVLGTHKLTIPKVPKVSCQSSCALEFWLDGEGMTGDYYSHNFTISATAAPLATASATSGIMTDKSAPDATSGAGANGVTPNGPIALVQNAAKGAQPKQEVNAAMGPVKTSFLGLATMIVTSLVASI
ncbi:hypothetical protein BGZ94_005217 [Podila epigama]|nr:hypothetical protein BGZ94_005217 [Podila epigama]